MVSLKAAQCIYVSNGLAFIIVSTYSYTSFKSIPLLVREGSMFMVQLKGNVAFAHDFFLSK